MMFPYGDSAYMGWMMLASILFWVALVALAIFAIVRLSPRPRDDSALAILNERLARGEIGSEEYESRRRLIVGR